MQLVDQFLKEYAVYVGINSTDPEEIANEVIVLNYFTPHSNTLIVSIAFGWFWGKSDLTDTVLATQKATCLCASLLALLNNAYEFYTYQQRMWTSDSFDATVNKYN